MSKPKNDPKAVIEPEMRGNTNIPRRDYYDNPAETHVVPCEKCGSKEWTDWILLPHKLFNEVGGYICFPCFIENYPSVKAVKT